MVNEGRPVGSESRQLALADGRVWQIVPGSELSSPLLLDLSQILSLPIAADLRPVADSHDKSSARVTGSGGAPTPAGSARYEAPRTSMHRRLWLEHMLDTAGPPTHEAPVIRASAAATGAGMQMFSLLRQLTAVVARDTVDRGGMLLHAALAKWHELGAILAAPGGTGKTTASGRLPPPWQSLCDDATLVVRDAQGKHWAHPWPTLSRFVIPGEGGSWQVEDAVLLRGIFFLVQSAEERLEAVGSGEAAAMLSQSARQASWGMMCGLEPGERRRTQLCLFDNVCSLARVIPTYVLHLSLTGAFWEELERVLTPMDPNTGSP